MTQFLGNNPFVITADLFTESVRLTCEIRMRQRRLSDYLNAIEGPFTTVEKASLLDLGQPDAAPRAFPFAELSSEAVILAIPYAGEPTGADPDGRRMVVVTKQPRRVVVLAPPFIIEGDMHLLREAGLRDALLSIRQQFVPLTNAQAIHQPTGRRYAGGVAIVRVSRIDALMPGSEG